jgi:virginiamycin A acetyltransferase
MFLKKISNFIYKIYNRHSIIRLQPGSSVSNTALLRGVNIKGKVIIHEHARVYQGVYLSGNIEIGRYTSLNGPNIDIYSKMNHVKIGNFCSIARNVSIQEFNHRIDGVSTFLINKNIFNDKDDTDISSKGAVVIGNDVWVGTQCVILSGVNIGNGAVVASNSVVIDNVPPFAIVGGSPARVIKYRFSEDVIEQLNALQWWDWDISKIKANKNLFTGTLTMEKFKHIN